MDYFPFFAFPPPFLAFLGTFFSSSFSNIDSGMDVSTSNSVTLVLGSSRSGSNVSPPDSPIRKKNEM